MSSLENRLFYVILFFLLFVSCSNERKKIVEQRKNILDKSSSIVGKAEYFKIYDNLSDSVTEWKNYQLGYYKYYDVSKKYHIDSLLCFNVQGNKFISVILQQQLLKEGVQDDVLFMYGAKVENEWLFWEGATMVLIRERYQDDIHTPIPFPKMQELATKYIYSNYLIKNETGEWIINDHFFDGFDQYNNIFHIYGDCLDCKNEIEFYRHCVAKNWSEYNAEKQVQKKWEIVYDTVSPVKPNITK